MDKARHPHVIRTWVVERTRIPFHPQTSKLWDKTRQDAGRHPNRAPGKPDSQKPQ